MARTQTFAEKFNIVDTLNAIATGVTGDNAPSRFLKEQLVAKGYVEKVKVPEAKKVPGSRGRVPVAYIVSKKGANYVRLSGQWKRPEGYKAPQIVEINVAPQSETVTA